MSNNQFPHIVFGQFLERARKSEGLTQKEMAQKLNLALEEYAEIETGKKLPERSALITIEPVQF